MLDWIANFINSVYDLPALIQWGGYGVLAAIVFAETGLFVGFFLPGDSLLVTAGLFAAVGYLDIFTLNLILIPAAIAGDSVGYWFGNKVGRSLYARPDSLFFRKSHLLRARAFYEKHGGKTIVLARFVPVVRTFAPIVAGIAEMPYQRFLSFNVLGGALWVLGMTLIGYTLGRLIPGIDKYLYIVVAVVIFLSFLPAAFEWWKERKAGA